jgi:hypothetical protein
MLRNQRANNHFLIVSHKFGMNIYVFFARELEDDSNEAHLSADMAAIQYSETFLQNQDDEVLDYEPSDEEDEYSRLQNPTKTPIIC